jgi:hypothetical protein
MSRVASNSKKGLCGPALASPARRLRVRQASGLRRDRKRGGRHSYLVRMWKSVCILLACFPGLHYAVPRRPEIASVLQRHDQAFESAVGAIVECAAPHLLDALFVPPSRKAPKDGRNARDTTLVDASLSMVGHVVHAIKLPFQEADKGVDNVLECVVRHIASAQHGIVDERRKWSDAVRRASRLVMPATKELRELVPKFARPIAGAVNFGLIEVLLRVVKWPHQNLVDCLIFGFCPVGDVPFTGVHRPIDEPEGGQFSVEDNANSFDEASRVLERKAKKHASADDEKDMCEVWDVSMQECVKGFCAGPLSRQGVKKLFAGAKHGPRCIPAFGIWQKGKLRRIDDALRSGHNALTRMWETIACCGPDLPARIAAEFAKYFGLKELRLRLGTDDIASAYRVLVSSGPEYNVAAVWRPASRSKDGKGKVMYFALRGFNFGLKSAPVHLATLMRPLVHVARVVLGVACADFYDDVVTVDLLCGKMSAQRALSFLFQLCGFPFAPKKHERLRGANAFLGVVTDFAKIACGYVILRVKQKRRLKLILELSEVLKSGKLSPAHAARLRGKLYFTTTTAFNGVGRAALQAFTARQYSKGRQTALNDDLRVAIEFFIQLLHCLPPANFHLVDDGLPPLYVWTDAMWEPLETDTGGLVEAVDDDGNVFYIAKACIAFTVFDPVTKVWHKSEKEIGIDVIRQMVPGKKTYIGQLEALAPTALLHTMPDSILKGRKAMMWVDNLAAKYGLQKGYSKVADSGRIINAFRLKQAALGMRVWFEWIPSEQNIADLPSRGKASELYRIFDAVSEEISGGEWECYEWDMVIPDFSSWTAPLAELRGGKRRKHHGSRGAKRSKKRD